MKNLIRKVFLFVMKPLLFYSDKVIIIGRAEFAIKNIFKCKMKGTKQFPVVVKNSIIGDVSSLEGTKIIDCQCFGKINLGRFVTLSGPGIKISGNVNGIDIGSFTSIAANVIIQEGEHDYNRVTTYFINRNIFKNGQEEELSKGKIVIGEDVWIGSNSVILSGVKVGRGAIIGAGSVVTKDVEPYSINIGVPSHKIKMRFSDEQIKLLEKSRWWEWDINKLKDNSNVFSDENFLQTLEQPQNINN